VNKLIQPHFLKFLLVGGLGTISNLTIFFLLVDILKFRPIPVSVGTFIITVLQNYLLNHYWTFSDVTKKKPANINGLIKFLFLAIIGLTINIVVLTTIILVFNPQFKVVAQAFGIAGGTIFNFIGSKYWIFYER
jgi:putative flippase GtrA